MRPYSVNYFLSLDIGCKWNIGDVFRIPYVCFIYTLCPEDLLQTIWVWIVSLNVTLCQR